MICEEVINSIGFDCHPLYDGHFAIKTPLTFSDCTPVYAFLMEEGGNSVITDGGDTMMAAYNANVLERRKFITTFADKLRAVDADFEDGKIVVRRSAWSDGFANFIHAILIAMEYISERSMHEVSEDALIEDVIHALVRRNPEIDIKKNAKLRGASEQEHTFPLMVDETVIYPLKPNSKATGSALRKLLDVEKAGYPTPLVVIDDRGNKDQARREEVILSSVVRVLSFSTLESGNTPINIAA